MSVCGMGEGKKGVRERRRARKEIKEYSLERIASSKQHLIVFNSCKVLLSRNTILFFLSVSIDVCLIISIVSFIVN